VLVLTQNKIQPYTGGGVLLTALFRHFPPENLMFFHREQKYADTGIYEEYRVKWSWLRFDLRALFSHLRLWFVALRKHAGSAHMKDIVALTLASTHFTMPRAIDRRVRGFRPDIIYAWAADSLWARTLRKTAKRYEVPYVIHFMDNHFELVPQTALQHALTPVFREELTRVASAAASLYTISESMGSAYRSYWNRPTETYRGSVEISSWPWPNKKLVPEDGVFRLGFAGSVDQSQLLGLLAAAKSMETLLVQGRRVRLVLYLTDYYARVVRRSLNGLGCVEIRAHPDSRDLREALASLDALVLAYGFDATTIKYYRYSFATKIAPYMLAGRPIIAYGPATIEPIDYCVRGGWALVVADSSGSSLTQAIEALMTDTALAERLAKAAWEAGCREHDSDTQAARFAVSMSRLAEMDGRTDRRFES